MSLQYEKEAAPIDAAEFEDENVQRATPVFPLYTVILIALLVVVSAFQLYADGVDSAVLGGENSVLIAGFVKQFFFAGQYWRILTGAALHGGIIHLAFNCYALFVLGKIIEVLSNRAHLAIVFLLSAIGGGILSLLFIPDIPSVGASGGIVGMLGYLTVYGYKRRKLLPDGFLKNMLFNVAFIAFVGVFVMSNVDNFGHLGGLAVGAAYGLLQIPGDLYADPRETGSATKAAGVAALGIFAAAALFSVLLLAGIINIEIPDFLYLS